ncbi:MAG: hypothetical protein HYV63_25375 [Candidatus Schekmanbacteria bacterium]|nr:hypothetical protein [Candidatus Schekmanbacteria bacterium]
MIRNQAAPTAPRNAVLAMLLLVEAESSVAPDGARIVAGKAEVKDGTEWVEVRLSTKAWSPGDPAGRYSRHPGDSRGARRWNL